MIDEGSGKWEFIDTMKQKNTFKLILAIAAVMFLLLPFITTFNSILTELINRFGFYKILQDTIVPFESRIVVFIVRLFKVTAFMAQGGDKASFYLLKDNEYYPVQLEWNCLGWQSLLLLFISFLVGFQGKFSKISIIECILIGLLGTFLINIFRMVFITVGVYYVDTVFALLIHDYFAALITIIWLLFFWWFSYKYVLEEKE